MHRSTVAELGDVMGSVELERLTGELFARLDTKDFETITAMMADDVQGVDEISRSWLRGRSAADEYFRTAPANVSNIKSSLSDLSVVETGDVGMVTGMLSQNYTHEGQAASIEAPTSIVFLCRGTDWKIALVHPVPLPEGS